MVGRPDLKYGKANEADEKEIFLTSFFNVFGLHFLWHDFCSLCYL